MNNLLTLEGPPGASPQGLGAPPPRYGLSREYWLRFQDADNTFYGDEYTFIASSIVGAHPEGGCIELRAHPWEAGKIAASFNPTQGQFCWPNAYPYTERKHLWEGEPERQEGEPGLFAAFYQDQPRESLDLFQSLYAPRFEFEPFMNLNRAQNMSIDLQMEMISKGYDPRKSGDLAGFFSGLKRAFTPPRSIRRAFGIKRITQQFTKATWKKTGRFAARAAVYGTGPAGLAAAAWMPASTRKRVLGLSDKQNKQAEVFAKVGRGIQIAGAVILTGGKAAAMMKSTSPGVAAKAGALKAGSNAVVVGKATTTTAATATTAAKTSVDVIAIMKTGAGLLIVKKLLASQIPNAGMIPEDGFIYDPSLDAQANSGFGQPFYPGGMEPALLPWTDDESPEGELEDDSPLVRAINAAAAKKKREEITRNVTLVGAGMALLYFLRR